MEAKEKSRARKLVARPLTDDEVDFLVEDVAEDVYFALCERARRYAADVLGVDLDAEGKRRGDWRGEWRKICAGVGAWFRDAAENC